MKIIILERNREVLQKVRVSGGGRCNVTHACFEPEKLINYYPRGREALLEAFQEFNPSDTIAWFERRGVALKTEADGRMFPSSNSSESIINCFLDLVIQHNIRVMTNTRVDSIRPPDTIGEWQIGTADEVFMAKKLIIATGSSTAVWEMLKSLNLAIIPAVPSLFTFNINDSRISDLMGLSVPNASCTISDSDFRAEGPVLITHWGLSGPAILKLSAWAARDLYKLNYKFKISINWLNSSELDIKTHLHGLISSQAKKNVRNNAAFGLPIRLWKNLCMAANISEQQKWAEIGKKHVQALSEQICRCSFEVSGKSTFKDEFVTAGGIDLSEINLTSFSSKQYQTLYMAGEVLNIDALTGGFNFQAAWTGAWHIAKTI